MGGQGGQQTAEFCTYFDRSYLSRGLALYGSLVRYATPFHLWVLCLDSTTREVLESLDLPGVRLIPLEILEAGDPELAAIKRTRSRIEYYFTCTPCLPRFIFQQHDPDIRSLTYLDADLCFYANPAPLLAAIDDHSIAVIPHHIVAPPPEYRT